MWIKRFRVLGYSSFRDSEWIDLGPSFNIFIGQNNVGKSALLKALVYPLEDIRHKSGREWREQFLPNPSVEFDINTSGLELRERVILTTNAFNIPISGPSEADAQILDSFFALDSITLQLKRFAGQQAILRLPSTSMFGAVGNYSVQFVGEAGNIKRTAVHAGGGDTIGTITDVESSQFSFYFGPQRLNLSQWGAQEQRRLQPDAQNLPAVLAFLQGSRPTLFEKLQSQVSQVIPTVRGLSVTLRGTNLEIMTWPERSSEDQLGFSLDRSGTGVAQVTAIITAAMLTKQSVIIIDEISSFLNPSAVKGLLKLLLSEYPSHQYIISAHSAEALTSIDPQSIYLVTKSGYESRVKKVNRANADHLRELSDSVGISMMDVFGAERLCWVEGQSEENCFPLLHPHDLPTVRYAAIRSPDVISGAARRREALVALFERITRTISPLVRGCSFAVDRDTMSVDAVNKLENAGNGRIHVLPRRNLENYLLHPHAIAKVVSSEIGAEIEITDVESAISTIAPNESFGGSSAWNGELDNAVWLAKVDGAKLVSAVFDHLTDNKLEFRKVRHDPMLIRSIIEYEPAFLDELKEFVQSVASAALIDW